MENGVVLIDFGGTTTNIAVYEEGDLQHVAVLPVGSVNITNDLAIGLKTELHIAEQVKLEHAVAVASKRAEHTEKVSVTHEKETHEFDVEDIDMIVDARLEEIFELINKELKSIGRAAKLPGGAVITGGGAQLTGIADYARQALQLSAKVARPEGFGGMAEQVASPAYSAAVGLMLIDLESGPAGSTHTQKSGGSDGIGTTINSITQKITGVLGKFRN
jgi:cell division protein FtsA